MSPYFFNAGLFNQGAALNDSRNSTRKRYSPRVSRSTCCSGPAYKGIPLVSGLGDRAR